MPATAGSGFRCQQSRVQDSRWHWQTGRYCLVLCCALPPGLVSAWSPLLSAFRLQVQRLADRLDVILLTPSAVVTTLTSAMGLAVCLRYAAWMGGPCPAHRRSFLEPVYEEQPWQAKCLARLQDWMLAAALSFALFGMSQTASERGALLKLIAFGTLPQSEILKSLV